MMLALKQFRRLAFLPFALLCACDPSAQQADVETGGTPAIAQTAPGSCTNIAGAPPPPDPLESQGTVVGHEILGSPGVVACSEVALGRVECEVTGPGEVQVVGPRGARFALAENQAGYLIVSADGAQCTLYGSE